MFWKDLQNGDQVGYFRQWGNFSSDVLLFAINELVGVDFKNGPAFGRYVGQISHQFAADGVFGHFRDGFFGRDGSFLGDVFGGLASGEDFFDWDSALPFGGNFFIFWIDYGDGLFAEGFGDDSEEIMILIEDLFKRREDSFGGFVGHGRKFFGEIHFGIYNVFE